MTHHVPVQKPLADDALFETLRGLHPSASQLREIDLVEKETIERRMATRKPAKRGFQVFKDARTSASVSLRRR